MNSLKSLFGMLYRFCTSWVGTIIIVLLLIFFIAQAFVIPSRSMVGTLYEGDFLFVKKFSYGVPIPRIPWLEVPVMPDLIGNGHIIEGDGPKRGDIVVFIPPHIPKQYFVKRTFAKGGDEVIFTKKGLYLHPSEGNEYVNEHYQDDEKIIMQGKLFVLEPYSKEHLGINYDEGSSSFLTMSDIYLGSRLAGTSPYEYSTKGGGISMRPEFENGAISFFYKKIEEGEYFMVGDNRNNSEDSRFWGSVPYKNIIGQPWFIYFSMNLEGSLEADARNNPKERYNIRWERMFKGIDGLEKMLKERQKNILLDKTKSYEATDTAQQNQTRAQVDSGLDFAESAQITKSAQIAQTAPESTQIAI